MELVGNANEIQVVADIFRDVRSREFREKLDAILRCPPDGRLERGFESLDEPSRENAYAVSYFFEDLGVLVSNDLIRREIVLTTVSSILTRAWHALRPAIDAERDFRHRTYAKDVSPTFLPHFEALVLMAVARQSTATRRGRSARPTAAETPVEPSTLQSNEAANAPN